MAEVIIIDVDCDPALYPKVNEVLGLDPTTGAGDWPSGLLSHVGSGVSEPKRMECLDLLGHATP